MIRRTVARAFGRSLESHDDGPPLTEVVAGDADLLQRVQRTFQEIHATLRREIDTDTDDDSSRVITPLESSAEGQEFGIQTPSIRCRIVNTMRGFIRIDAERRGAAPAASLLTFHPDEEGVSQLIEKPDGRPRSGYLFTSVPKLVRRLLAEEE